MIVYWRVSTSTASVEVVRLGIHAAREHACAAILDCFPGQLHGGYAFAKQDAYKLAKVGLSFNPDSVDEAAASLMGNKIPSAVPLRGTRMFIGADKVLQMVAQSCTAFQPKNSFLVRRVDSQTFGVGVEHSVLKLVFVPL